MLIKFDVTDEEAALVKVFTGQNVGSKAYYQAATQALELSNLCRDQRETIRALERRIAVQQQTIERARSAAALLLEAAGQGDLLDV